MFSFTLLQLYVKTQHLRIIIFVISNCKFSFLLSPLCMFINTFIAQVPPTVLFFYLKGKWPWVVVVCQNDISGLIYSELGWVSSLNLDRKQQIQCGKNLLNLLLYTLKKSNTKLYCCWLLELMFNSVALLPARGSATRKQIFFINDLSERDVVLIC